MDEIKLYNFTIKYYKYSQYQFVSLLLNNELIVDNIIRLIEFNTTLQLFINNKLDKKPYTIQNFTIQRVKEDNEEAIQISTYYQQFIYNKQQIATINAVLTKFISKSTF